jgi:hypothetical protein
MLAMFIGACAAGACARAATADPRSRKKTTAPSAGAYLRDLM